MVLYPFTSLDNRVMILTMRITPAVWAIVYTAGAMGDPTHVPLAPAWTDSALFWFAAFLSAWSAVAPGAGVRAFALLVGVASTLSRGLTLIIISPNELTRKSELIVGGVWLSLCWFAIVIFTLAVPVRVQWLARRDANRRQRARQRAR